MLTQGENKIQTERNRGQILVNIEISWRLVVFSFSSLERSYLINCVITFLLSERDIINQLG